MFLPGASGDVALWQPVADLIAHRGRRRFFSWPGFRGVPLDPSVGGLGDLVERVVVEITEPVVLLAQSMGGVIALQAALAVPKLVKALVLSVTSGGIDLRGLGASDWRPEFARRNPDVPRWFLDARDDMTSRLHQVTAPTLLLWGDADEISPVAVGRRLTKLLPRSALVIVPGGTHDLVRERASEVAPLIDEHLHQLGRGD
jgi:pimeloyl-ACP methyl ester carboxylesterase